MNSSPTGNNCQVENVSAPNRYIEEGNASPIDDSIAVLVDQRRVPSPNPTVLDDNIADNASRGFPGPYYLLPEESGPLHFHSREQAQQENLITILDQVLAVLETDDFLVDAGESEYYPSEPGSSLTTNEPMQ
ncbi:unnamed protein product [Cylindrotheca closterium]|uniref:Uncharacterized protein n=1 Tax=Cylindrotheca closterium TaxID=2856 RepID=A0AAD2FVK5_9STRA|nr:unnamed protein product [Cylindrotheca closterium]